MNRLFRAFSVQKANIVQQTAKNGNNDTVGLLLLPTEILLDIVEQCVLETDGTVDLTSRAGLLFCCRRLQLLAMQTPALWTHIIFKLYVSEDISNPKTQLKRAVRVFQQSASLSGQLPCFLEVDIGTRLSRRQTKAIDEKALDLKRLFYSVAWRSKKTSYQVPLSLYPIVISRFPGPTTELELKRYAVKSEVTTLFKSRVTEEVGMLMEYDVTFLLLAGSITSHVMGLKSLTLDEVSLDFRLVKNLANLAGLSELRLARIACEFITMEAYTAGIADGPEMPRLTKLSLVGTGALVLARVFQLPALQVAHLEPDPTFPSVVERCLTYLVTKTPVKALSFPLVNGISRTQLLDSPHVKFIWFNIAIDLLPLPREDLQYVLSCENLAAVHTRVLGAAQSDDSVVTNRLSLLVNGRTGEDRLSVSVPLRPLPDSGSRFASTPTKYLFSLLGKQQVEEDGMHGILDKQRELNSMEARLRESGHWKDPVCEVDEEEPSG